MPDFIYRPQAAINAEGELVTDAAGAVYAITDTNFVTPLVVRDLAGLTSATIEVSGIGQTRTFILDRPEVWWKSGQYICHLFSVTSMVENTAAAALAAQTAQVAAESAPATAAEHSVPGGGSAGQVLTKESSADGDIAWRSPASGGGTASHGSLSGLGNDDHTQYLNNDRGDARYYTKAEVDTRTAAAAGANSTADRSRTNHTGTQAISTITGLQTALDQLGGTAVNSVAGKTGAVILAVNDLSDATAYGKSLLGTASAAAARSLLGAGTSSLSLGTTSSTAMRGDKHLHITGGGAVPAGTPAGTLITRPLV